MSKTNHLFHKANNATDFYFISNINLKIFIQKKLKIVILEKRSQMKPNSINKQFNLPV